MKTKTRLTRSAFCEHSTVPALASAVIRQSGGWETFKEHAPDVASYGAAGGFSGWIYHTETVAFTRKNRKTIAELAEGMAEDLGDTGAVALVRGFNCFRGDMPSEGDVARTLYGTEDGDTHVANALAWFALEEVSRAYVDASED